MKQIFTKFFHEAKPLILALIIAGGISFVYAAGWTAPQDTFPNCVSGHPGCDAPINVSSIFQYKLGQFSVGTSTQPDPTVDLSVNRTGIFGALGVAGDSVFGGNVTISSGTPGVGKVLKAVDSNGKVGWADASAVSGNSVPSGVIATTTSGSWKAPAGITRIRVRIWGGGGGGGDSAYVADYGRGGGGGGYSESVLAVVPGATYNYTVGNGGEGGGGGTGGSYAPLNYNCTNGTTINMYQGCAGGKSTFSDSGGSVIMTANGGKGGDPSFNDTTTHYSIGWSGSSYGGTANGGNVMNLIGGNSDLGLNKSEKGGSGRGGDSPMGGQGGFAMSYCGISPAQIGLGDAGTAPGGGGGGGCAYSGGSGAPGMVVIEY